MATKLLDQDSNLGIPGNNRPLCQLSYRALRSPWEQWDREESNLALPGFNRPRRLQRFSPLVDQEGFEPSTSSLSARRPNRTGPLVVVVLVGQAGLEPAISCTQSRRDGRFPTARSCPPPESNRDAPKGTAF